MVRSHPVPRRWRVAFDPELALDVPRGPQTTNVGLDVDDKPALFAFQSLFSAREGRRVTLWETLNRVLALAMEHPEVEEELARFGRRALARGEASGFAESD